MIDKILEQTVNAIFTLIVLIVIVLGMTVNTRAYSAPNNKSDWVEYCIGDVNDDNNRWSRAECEQEFDAIAKGEAQEIDSEIMPLLMESCSHIDAETKPKQFDKCIKDAAKELERDEQTVNQ